MKLLMELKKQLLPMERTSLHVAARINIKIGAKYFPKILNRTHMIAYKIKQLRDNVNVQALSISMILYAPSLKSLC